jgi:hypothetical protein
MQKLKGPKEAAGRHQQGRYLILQLLCLGFLILMSGCGVIDLPTSTPAVSGNNSVSDLAAVATDLAVIVPEVATPSPTPTFTAFAVTSLPTVTALPPTDTPAPPTNTPPPPTLPARATPTPAKPTATPSPLPGQTVPFFENVNGPVELLQSYYNAINRREYERAYSYWESPGTSVNSTPPVYAQFVKGYATTASVVLTTGMASGQGAAGSAFVDVPVVLVATNTNRTHQTFYGCYTVRRANPAIATGSSWHIYTARIKNAPANAGVNSLLGQGCKAG